MDTLAHLVGVDIGGTKIAAAALDASGVLSHRLIRPTPRGSEAVLDVVADLVAELAGSVRVGAVGVGAPGVIDARDGSVLSSTDVLPGWAGTAVRCELQRRTGLPVAVDNDVRVMARGELALGAGRGYHDVIFVSVGTGVGGALARDGRVVTGPHGTAGELAHLLIPGTGAIACGCGRRDHLEGAVSGPAITAAYAARSGTPAASLHEVAALMRLGDPIARNVVTEAGVLLGRVLAGLVAAVDVEVVVVGGGVAQIGSDFLGPLVESLRSEALPPLRHIAVQAAILGTDAPLIGAARLAASLLPAGER